MVVVAMALSNGSNGINGVNGINGSPPDDPRLSFQTYEENGRQYCQWHRGQYVFPIDEAEQDRLDCFHKFFIVARKKQIHRVPIDPSAPLRILDLGTGTGIWALEMASKYPNATVWGVDLCAKMNPATNYPNNRFAPMDMEGPWKISPQFDQAGDFQSGPWDMVHLRALAGSIHSWPDLYRQVYSHLKPQQGYMEQVEVDWYPRNDQGPVSHSLKIWADEVLGAMDRAGRPMRLDPGLAKQTLASTGFVDIEEVVIRVPVNGAYRDLHQVDIGRWFNLGVHKGLMALTLAPLTRFMGRNPNDVKTLHDLVLQEMNDRDNKSYFNLYIWTARKS